MAMASEEIVQLMNNVKAPYNVNKLTAEVAFKALDNLELYRINVARLNPNNCYQVSDYILTYVPSCIPYLYRYFHTYLTCTYVHTHTYIHTKNAYIRTYIRTCIFYQCIEFSKREIFYWTACVGCNLT